MNIIVITVTLAIGVCIGLIFGLILWLKQTSDDITKFDIEIARLHSELVALEEQVQEVIENGNDD